MQTLTIYIQEHRYHVSTPDSTAALNALTRIWHKNPTAPVIIKCGTQTLLLSGAHTITDQWGNSENMESRIEELTEEHHQHGTMTLQPGQSGFQLFDHEEGKSDETYRPY